jgi:hypothetical protein
MRLRNTTELWLALKGLPVTRGPDEVRAVQAP